MNHQQFAVIGMGRFGKNLAMELTRLGYEVLAIDQDEKRVRDAVNVTTHAVQADSMDVEALTALGIRNFDVVVVAIGENIQANILTTIILKELGVKKIIAKAQNAMHGKVLEKIGTDLVIYPERDIAIKLANSLVSKNFLEQINLSADYSIIELFAPPAFHNKSIEHLAIRKKLGLTILAIRRGETIIVAPEPRTEIYPDDVLVVLGHNHDLEKINN